MLKKEIKEFIQKLVKGNGDLGHMVEYGDYLLALSDLSEVLEHYTTPTKDGYPKLKDEDYQILHRAYEAAIEEGKRFTHTVNDYPGNYDSDIVRAKMVSEFETLLAKDYDVIDTSIGAKEKTIFDLFELSRGLKLSISSADMAIAGANMSSRIPVSYTADNGEVVKGFFTESESIDPVKDYKQVYDKAVEGHPEYKEIFKDIMGNAKFKRAFKYDNSVDIVLKPEVTRDNFTAIADKYIDAVRIRKCKNKSEKEKAKITQKYEDMKNRFHEDEEFAIRFYHMAKEHGTVTNKHSVYKNGPQIGRGANVSDRNVAMSEIAAAFGTPDLLAHSAKMKLVVDGVEKKGTFMAFAKGIDINHIDEENPIHRLTAAGVDNPAAFKSIADLQVLDYICGNTDRHMGNMFYQTEETAEGVKLTGVVGIDNDCSMGKLNPKEDGAGGYFVGTNRMLVISEEYANRIESMTKDMLELRLQGLDLSKEEIDAAYTRLCQLRDEIERGKLYFAEYPEKRFQKGYIRVVKDEDWENYTLRDLAYAPDPEKPTKNDCQNYFANIYTLPGVVNDREREHLEEETKKKFWRDINPALVPPKAEFKIAPAAVLRETNRAGIAHNNHMLNGFESRLAHVDAGLFIGSKEFGAMREQFKKVNAIAKQITVDTDAKTMQAIGKEYQKLQRLAKAYMDMKEQERAKKGALSKRSESRLAFAKDLCEFTTERTANIFNELNENKVELSKAKEVAQAKPVKEMNKKVPQVNP